MSRGDKAQRQRLMPEGAANPASSRPRKHPTKPVTERLYDGHLTAECSIRCNNSPTCPACLTLQLGRRFG